MPVRARLLAGVAGAALVVGAVVALRVPASPPPEAPPVPDEVTRYAADAVVLPEPGAPPPPPAHLAVVPEPSWQRLSWTGSAPGYEVRWPGGARLVVGQEAQLDRLAPGTPIEVRAVDPYGQVSAPARAVAAEPVEPPWRAGLTGLYDDFATDATVRADAPGSLWHLSGYRGCVEIGAPGRAGLPVDLGCGSDVAVLRSRVPLRLVDGAGRAVVLTDASAGGGTLTVELAPGPADRFGGEPVGVRAVLRGSIARVEPGGGEVRLPPRGVGVLHAVEVEVGPSGVALKIDGRVVARSSHVPAWDSAYLLVGVEGPRGKRARVHIAGAGFSGPPARVAPVVEVPVNVATRQVLPLSARAPALGISRRPLATAAAARVVVTVTAPDGAAGMTVQLGPDRLPTRLASPTKPGPGAVATLIADIPTRLLGPTGPDTLTPLVVRGPTTGASVVESYLEVEPSPDAVFPPAPVRPPYVPVLDSLPTCTVLLGDSAGAPLANPTVPRDSRMVVHVELDGWAAQWDSGYLMGVLGFELRLDGLLLAAVPTAVDTPAAGGRYAVALALGGVEPGEHVLETEVVGVGGRTSTLTRFRIR